MLSIAVAAGFILVQKNLKRLLAYSSIEHIGIICAGVGIGGPLGLYGALLHIFNHAVTKATMFLCSGSIVKKYGTHNMNDIRGIAGALPFTGVVFAIASFALAGSPPFSIFLSEIFILISAFTKGNYLAAGLLLAFISIAFGGLVYHLSRIIFGRRPENMGVTRESLGGTIAFLFLLVFICLMGFTIPLALNNLILSSIEILKGA